MAGFAGNTRALVIALLVFNFCILSTFAEGDDDDDEKHDYIIKISNVVTHHKQRDLFSGETNLWRESFNDTTLSLHAVLDMTNPLPADLLISLIISQKDPKTNQWAQKIQQSHTFCDYIEKNTYFVNNVYRDTNFPTTCPVAKGKYFIKNMIIDNSEFPKHLEESKWKAEIELVMQDTKRSVLKFSIEVDIEAIDEE